MKKIILITGASSDIGIAYIKQCHEQYDIIISHYNNGNSVLLELKQSLGKKMILIQADFNNPESVQAMIQTIMDFGYMPEYVLHLTAPKYENVKFSQTNWELFEQGLHTSLRSIVMLLEAFCPFMVKKRYGKIVFMLSAYTGGKPPKFSSPYITVKYALLGLMKELSAEYADKGITVNALSPSMIETKFLAKVPDYIVQQNAIGSPLGRNLMADDLVSSLAFLLSSGADYITGENLFITGGS